MLRTWHENLESLEAIKQDELTRDLVLRMSALSQAGKLGPFLFELAHDAELDEMTKGTLGGDRGGPELPLDGGGLPPAHRDLSLAAAPNWAYN